MSILGKTDFHFLGGDSEKIDDESLLNSFEVNGFFFSFDNLFPSSTRPQKNNLKPLF